MEDVFLKLLNMSISASWLVLAVVILRLTLKKAPKSIICILWSFVALRLVCPFTFESILSLIPSAETLPENIVYSASPAIQSGVSMMNYAINPIIESTLSPTMSDKTTPAQIAIILAFIVWIVGITVITAHAVVSYARIKRNVRERIPLRENIWICDRIPSPFILGFFRPRIFLPSTIDESDTEYVIAHEKAHIKRGDHIWKIIGFILLTVYWFNPAIWVAYLLFCRDIEFACDEKVVKSFGKESKKPYANALINCSMPRKALSACPLAFGEVGVKNRIKSILKYKKASLGISIGTIIITIAVAVCFLTDPISLYQPKIISCYSIEENTWIKFSNNDSIRVSKLWNSKTWKPYTEPHIPTDDVNYRFKIHDTTVWYSSETGKLTDISNKAYLILRSNEKEFMNSVIEKYDFPQIEFSIGLSIDNVYFDINNDGEEEICKLSYGHTSGLQTFVLFIHNNSGDELLYGADFEHPYDNLYFAKGRDGKLRVVIEETDGEETVTELFDIIITQGRQVNLSQNGKSLKNHTKPHIFEPNK